MSDECPEGWTECELQRCVDVLDYLRVPVNSEERAKRQGSIPYYGATGQVGWIDDFIFDEELVLVGEDGAPFLDKSKPIAYVISGKAWVNNHAHVLRANPKITSNRYLKYFLDSFDFHEYVNGTTRLKLTQGSLNFIPVRLAPLTEQGRIISKLEQLLAKASACQQRLAKVSVLVTRFRQSVLAAACSGRLTADWREHHADEKDVKVVLAEICRRRYSQATTASQRERIAEIFSAQPENPRDSTELPEGWQYVTLDKLCSSFDYGTAAKSRPAGKVPVLRMGNLQRGEVDWTDLVYTSNREEIDNYSLQPNTVLFNRTNSPELVGKTAIYRGERPAIFAGYLIRINPLPELDPEYLNYCLNTNDARGFCSRVKTDGVSQSNINARKLALFELPFCSAAEQREAVRRVRSLFALADTIVAELQKAQARVDNLALSVLTKAFRGELVPAEADLARRERRGYEPACLLLERMQQRRGGHESKGARAIRSRGSMASSKHIKRTAQGSRRAGMSR